MRYLAMSDQMRDEMWTALGDKVEPGWAPEREWAVRAAIARRVNRQRAVARATVAVASTALIAVGGLAVVKWRSAVPVTARNAPAAGAGIETVTVTQLSPDTVLAPRPDRDGRGFALRAGGARFSVPHDTRRPFVVTAGDVVIEDLGTTFTVRYLAADRLNIAVEEGRVRVRGRGTDTEVSAGAMLEIAVSPLAEI